MKRKASSESETVIRKVSLALVYDTVGLRFALLQFIRAAGLPRYYSTANLCSISYQIDICTLYVRTLVFYF